MTKYKSYDVLNESFIEDVKGLVNDEFFNHYYLINIIGEVFNRRAQFDEAFIFKTSADSWSIGFSAFGNFLLYGKNWKDEQVDFVIKKNQTVRFKERISFGGNLHPFARIKVQNLA